MLCCCNFVVFLLVLTTLSTALLHFFIFSHTVPLITLSISSLRFFFLHEISFSPCDVRTASICGVCNHQYHVNA